MSVPDVPNCPALVARWCTRAVARAGTSWRDEGGEGDAVTSGKIATFPAAKTVVFAALTDASDSHVVAESSLVGRSAPCSPSPLFLLADSCALM